MLNRWRRKTQFIALFSVLVLLIAACGGGGGASTSATSSSGGAGTSATTGTGGAGTSATTTGGGTSATAGAGAATATTGGGGAAATTTGGGAGATAAATTGGAGAGATTAATTGAGAGATTAAGGGAAPTVATCPATAKGAKITMWSPLTGQDGKFMTELASKFSSNNPQGVTVSHVAQPDYLTKLQTAAAGKNLPEMTVIREGDIAGMAVRNIIKPLSAEMNNILGIDKLKADFPPQYWDVGDYKGQHYTIPLDDHPLVLFYNKDMFQKAGIGAPPKTWQEFEQDADKLTQNGVMGASIGTAFDGSTLFQTLLAQYGGTQVNQDATEATYNSEAGVKALTYLRDLKKKYSPKISGTGDPEVTPFRQGKSAMVMHGPWWISDLEKLPFTGFAPVPQLSGGKKGVWGGSHQLAITTADATKQAAAACWMSWLSANSVQWAAAGQIPARNSVRTNGSELQKIAAPIAAIAEEADYSIIPPGGVVDYGPAIFSGGFEPQVDAVLLGQQQDVKKALDTAAAKSNQILKQNRQRYQ